MKSDPGATYYCQAIDSIEGKLYGCHNPVDIQEDDVKLQRPSVKVPYQMFCKAHNHRLLLHNCCPTCGIFCTQVRNAYYAFSTYSQCVFRFRLFVFTVVLFLVGQLRRM